MRKPTFSNNFSLTENQRTESGAWIVIGNMHLASEWANQGSRRVLCVPDGDDPFSIDWSALRGESVSQNCTAMLC